MWIQMKYCTVLNRRRRSESAISGCLGGRDIENYSPRPKPRLGLGACKLYFNGQFPSPHWGPVAPCYDPGINHYRCEKANFQNVWLFSLFERGVEFMTSGSQPGELYSDEILIYQNNSVKQTHCLRCTASSWVNATVWYDQEDKAAIEPSFLVSFTFFAAFWSNCNTLKNKKPSSWRMFQIGS